MIKIDIRKINLLKKLATSLVVSKTPTPQTFKFARLNTITAISSFHTSPISTADYKTPTNRHKVFRPTTVSVTKQNQHLMVDLSDENEIELGKVNLQEANEMAKSKNLRLVLVDESASPPKFRLMHGSDLVKLQMQAKHDGVEDENHHLRTKEIQFNLGISDHDLEIKAKMGNNFVEKGHDLIIHIKSKGHDIKVIRSLNKQTNTELAN